MSQEGNGTLNSAGLGAVSISDLERSIEGLIAQKQAWTTLRNFDKNPSSVDKKLSLIEEQLSETQSLISKKRKLEADNRAGDAKRRREMGKGPARLNHTPVYYADYLRLDKLLDAQEPLSVLSDTNKPAHEELLFIIVHQAYELWFKQIMHEMESIIEMMSKPQLGATQIPIVVHRLNRINTILKLMINQFDVLETMTPLDFMDFRDFLFPASGFQSFQFRMFEVRLGVTHNQRVNPHYQNQLKPPHQQLLNSLESKPSLFDVIQQWLERTPFVNLESHQFDFLKLYRAAVERMFDEDHQIIQEIAKNDPTGALSDQERLQLENNKKNFLAMTDPNSYEKLSSLTPNQRHLSFTAMKAALMIYTYQEQPVFHLPFALLQGLVDVDENFTAWRYRHALMVQRMIGTKVGTGGSSGAAYLKASLERSRVFLDFGNLSTYLMPRKDLPPLPEHIKQKLGFVSDK